MLNQQCAILTVIDSYIEPLLIGVLSTDKLGICCGTIEVDSMSSNCGKIQRDRFKLSIPYAKQNLTWNVFFDSQCPEMGPDFIFNDNNFLADMDVDTLSAKVPSLAKWNHNDKNALLNVLVELLSCYKQHQIQLLQKQARLQLEYNMLMESTEIKQEDVEMILLPFTSKPTEARFLISLLVDLSQLPIRPWKSESDIAILVVTFSGADWNRITPQLNFSKSLEEILGKTGALHIPHFPPDKHLIDYVLKIKKHIAEKINSIVENFDKKREYITAFLTINNTCCLEYDAANFTFISSLFCINDFYFMLHIELSLEFPVKPPIIKLISTYHMKSPFEPYSEVIDNYPYNDTWKPNQMLKKLFESIKQYVKKFKSNSIENCSL